MKRTLAIIAFAALSLSLAKCSKNPTTDLSPERLDQGAALDSLSWEVGLRSPCAADREECLAAYGFAINQDGTWTVGPGPEGQHESGKLEPVEIATLSSLLNRISGSVEGCVDVDDGASSESIILNRSGAERILSCAGARNSVEAEALHRLIRELALKYYPLPFPDACLEAASEVHAVHDGLSSCNTDTECSYLDSNLEPIPYEIDQFVTVDDCSRVRPMAVGNIVSVLTHRDQLSAAFENARAICGERMVRSDCTGVTGFMSSLSSPVCQRGHCRVHPSMSP
jgi:hypothetical protein